MPDDTTLVVFRRRLKASGVYERLMDRVVEQAKATGVGRGWWVIVDGTRVAAGAAIRNHWSSCAKAGSGWCGPCSGSSRSGPRRCTPWPGRFPTSTTRTGGRWWRRLPGPAGGSLPGRDDLPGDQYEANAGLERGRSGMVGGLRRGNRPDSMSSLALGGRVVARFLPYLPNTGLLRQPRPAFSEVSTDHGPRSSRSLFTERNSLGSVKAVKKRGLPLKARGETGPTAMKGNSRRSGRGALWGSRND